MDTRPIHYALRFEPDLRARRFSGSARIDVEIRRPASRITMNAAELDVRACRLVHGGKSAAVHHSLDARSETLTLRVPRGTSGRATVEVDFEGTLNDRLLGFYCSTYRVRGREERMATTQFEAADARRAFPCWDEPSAKATFDVTIVAPRGMAAVSNMPVASRRAARGGVEHAFERTPRMPTYLLYLGVGRLESISTTSRGVKISVLATRGNARRGKFALALARRLLAEYERYFGIRYPLPKLDLIAVPDFAAGAMENWGAITFREALLLHDERTSSTRTAQLIAEVVSHEIAHQWFGNLVTMKWWNDLWLNESFATFMATKFVDKIRPEWRMWDQFAEDTVANALRLDSLRSTHPIDVRVESPAEIREIFDAISYDKGGSVLQMVERLVGEPAFRRGLRAYLRRFSYGNAEGADLWREIGRAAGRDIGPLVRSWIGQPGYPLLTVSRSGRAARIAQERFLLERPRRAPPRQLWHVPVAASGARGPPRVVSRRSAPLPRLRAGAVVNASRAAFARVRYGEGDLAELRRAAESGEMRDGDAWMVQGDLLALCRAGMAGVRDYLAFADACSGRTGYLVSSGIGRSLRLLHRLSLGEAHEWRLRERSLEHHARMHARLGWRPARGEAHVDSLLRGEAIGALGVSLRAGAVVRGAQEAFERLASGRGAPPADLREPVCSIAVAAGGARAYRRVRAMYDSAGTQEEQVRYLAAMCATPDAGLLARTLELSQSPAVRTQNMHVPVSRVAANPAGAALVWPWLRRAWPRVSRRAGTGNPLLARMISSVAVAASDMETAASLESFFARRPSPGTERTVRQAAETIRINARLRERMGRELGALD